MIFTTIQIFFKWLHFVQWQSLSTSVDKHHLHLLKQSPWKAHSGFCWHFKKLPLLIWFLQGYFSIQRKTCPGKGAACTRTWSLTLQVSVKYCSHDSEHCAASRERRPKETFENTRVFILRMRGSPDSFEQNIDKFTQFLTRVWRCHCLL